MNFPIVRIAALSGVLAGLAILAYYVVEARRAALRTAAQGPLNQIALALHNYHDVYGCLPPAVVYDPAGRPMHSWRVLLLPYLEEGDLYQRYDLSQPWDSAKNLVLLDQMPRVYGSPTEEPSTRHTNFMVIRGANTAFPLSGCRRFEEFADGPSNVLLVVESARSVTPWTKPQDIDFAAILRGRTNLSAVHWRAPFVVFADTIHAYAVQNRVSEKELQALATITGGESIDRQKMLNAGKLK